MPTPDTYGTDKPLTGSGNDQFQREHFAKRIAETIRTRQSPDSLIVGLYGRWGEGKTSVLNFITEDLQNSGIIVMPFNPWRLEGEDQLLMGFFSELAQVLDISLANDSQQTDELVRKYAEAVMSRLAFLGGDSTKHSLTEPISKLMTQVSLQGLKEQIEGLLSAANKRVLIIIDDIDRLNKQEIQALFRLVKLTGDFKYTTYLLAFDDEMVAHAIGEAYGGDTAAAGHNFLEKIIQVPLRLPTIQLDVLESFSYKRVMLALLSTNTELSPEELNRFEYVWRTSVVPQISSPRQVIRYNNSLTFALPLLRGEVNVVDLMLIEALKQFYYPLYEYISKSQSLITGTEYSQKDGMELLRTQFEKLLAQYSSPAKKPRRLLASLFPKAGAIFYPKAPWTIDSRKDEALYEKKSIASDYYFKRYFSYAVQPGEIPDQAFNEFISLMARKELDLALPYARRLIERASDIDFLKRVEKIANHLPASHADIYCQLLSYVSDQFLPQTITNRNFNIFSLTSRLFISLLEKIPESKHRFDIAEEILAKSCSFEFSKELISDIHKAQLYYGQSDEPAQDTLASKPKLFTEEEFQQLAQVFVDRALATAGTQALYVDHPYVAEFLLLGFWQIASGPEPANKYLRERLTNNPHELKRLLEVFSPSGYLNHVLVRSNVREQVLSDIARYLDADYLYQVARQLVGDEKVEAVRQDSFYVPNDDERLRQFIYLYEQRRDRIKEEADLSDALEKFADPEDKSDSSN